MRPVRLTLIFAAALAAFLFPALASADGITWTLNNVSLSDGGAVSGSFNYDASSNLYSAIGVTSTPGTQQGSPFLGTSYNTLTDAVFFTYTVVGLGPNPLLGYNGGNLTGATVLELFFTNPLTNAGGTDSVTAVEFLCGDSACDSLSTRYSVSGAVTGVPISTPEPASLFLLAAGVLAIALLRRFA